MHLGLPPLELIRILPGLSAIQAVLKALDPARPRVCHAAERVLARA